MRPKALASAVFTLLGAAALLAASAVLTLAVTMAASDGSWSQTIVFDQLGEGPWELILAWALLPAAGWVLRGALENEARNLAADADEAQTREPAQAPASPTPSAPTPSAEPSPVDLANPSPASSPASAAPNPSPALATALATLAAPMPARPTSSGDPPARPPSPSDVSEVLAHQRPAGVPSPELAALGLDGLSDLSLPRVAAAARTPPRSGDPVPRLPEDLEPEP